MPGFFGGTDGSSPMASYILGSGRRRGAYGQPGMERGNLFLGLGHGKLMGTFSHTDTNGQWGAVPPEWGFLTASLNANGGLAVLEQGI